MKLKDTYSLEGKMTNLDSIFKSRDITFPTKVCLLKAMVFPVVIYGCESWTVKKAEHQRIDAFELWCWRRLLRVAWTARRSNQSILEEINPEYSLEGLMLKLKFQYLGHLMVNSWLIGKDPNAGKDWGQEKKGVTEDEMVRWHQWLDGWMWELDHKETSADELMLLNCGIGKDSWGSLGLQGDPTSPFWRRSALGFLWKEWC